jgi:hypothetical protein
MKEYRVISSILYPDSGNPLEDASILRNAVYFSTAQRVYSANLILKQLPNVNQRIIDFLTIEAFEEFMTSTEDMLGWFFALKEWQPGNAEFCLCKLLNSIEVGKKNSESQAVTILSTINNDSFRDILHIPNDNELTTAGLSDDQINRISQSINYKLQGWLTAAKMRAEQGRGLVRIFNKCKHHMFAIPTDQREKAELWVPAKFTFDKKEHCFHLENGWLESSQNEVIRFVGNSIGAQVTLHDTLAIILSTRYKERYVIPEWVTDAYQTDYLWRH